MSVPSLQRDHAAPEFILKAAELEATTGQRCSKLPKRWAYTRTRYITDVANEILEHACRANCLYVTNKETAHQRMCHLLEARAACYVLINKLDCLEKFPPTRKERITMPDGSEKITQKQIFSSASLLQWRELARHELVLLSGVIRSDKKRFCTWHTAPRPKTSHTRKQRKKIYNPNRSSCVRKEDGSIAG